MTRLRWRIWVVGVEEAWKTGATAIDAEWGWKGVCADADEGVELGHDEKPVADHDEGDQDVRPLNTWAKTAGTSRGVRNHYRAGGALNVSEEGAAICVWPNIFESKM